MTDHTGVIVSVAYDMQRSGKFRSKSRIEVLEQKIAESAIFRVKFQVKSTV